MGEGSGGEEEGGGGRRGRRLAYKDIDFRIIGIYMLLILEDLGKLNEF